MKSRICLILLFVLFISSALAEDEPPVMQDFAYALNVDVNEQGALWEVTLPEDVYRHVVRADLGDLRVFNQQGQLVAHALRIPETVQTQARAPADLPIFPLYQDQEDTAIGRTINIVTDDQGRIIQADDEAITHQKQKRISAYLIDISQLEESPYQLELNWQHEMAEGFATEVTLDSSQDLVHWRPFGSAVPVADLRANGHELVHRILTLPSIEAKYFRLNWPEALSTVRLGSITAKFAGTASLPEKQWLTVQGTISENHPENVEYDSGGNWPLVEIKISFGKDNTVMQGALMSRNAATDSWRKRHSGIYYQVNTGQATLDSDPISLSYINDRYWRLSATNNETVLAQDNAPELLIGWMPYKLVFLAQGMGTYTIAYGGYGIKPQSKSVDHLLQKIKYGDKAEFIKMAQIKSTVTLGGERQKMAPPSPTPWKKWLLWAVLIAGVGLMLMIVRQIYRQLNSKPPEVSESD